MSGYIFALALAATGSGVAAAQQAAAPEQLASVKGVVTNAFTGEPLRKALVRLDPESGNDARPATTDEQGRFSFENLKPGTYGLAAERVGFIRSLLADSAGTTVKLRLAAGETANVNLKLAPQAAISGRVVDSDEDPWANVSLQLYRSVFKQGKRRLERHDLAEVDDRGQFRVGQLPSGTYYLIAEPNIGTEQFYRSASEGHLQPTWYPNSFDKEGSTPIIVSPGQELSGLEIRLRRSATYRIRGTVLGLDSLPPNPRASAIGMNLNVLASSGSSDAPTTYRAQPRPNGSFEIKGVPSGDYDVGLSQPFLPVGLGRVKVRVDDRDVDGVSIDVSRTHPLKGTLRFESNETSGIPGLLITLTDLASGSGSQFIRARDDSSFEFPITIPGRYRVWVPATSSEQYFLKPVRYQNLESRSGVISLSEGDGPLELVLSKSGARVAVNVKRGDVAPSTVAARVVLVPDTDNSEERGFGTQTAVRDQNGALSIRNIPPGAYRLFAFENVPDDAWVDAEFWKDIRSKGVELSVSEGESKTAEAPLVMRSEIVALLGRLGME